MGYTSEVVIAVLSLACAACLLWMVLNPNVNEGFTIKSGLWCIIFAMVVSGGALLIEGPNAETNLATAALLRVGVLITFAGIIIRTRHLPKQDEPRQMRRSTDFGVLDETHEQTGKHA